MGCGRVLVRGTATPAIIMKGTDDLLTELREFSGHDLPRFSDCVRTAFAAVGPVFHRQKYAEFFFHCASTVPAWLARVLMANADAESHGSEKLFWLWLGSSANATIARDVLVHAKDESRHSRVFVSLIDKAFPGALPPEDLRSKRGQLFTVPSDLDTAQRFQLPEDHLMDHLVQMNMGEIRTRVHMLLLAPVIHAFAPDDAKDRVAKVLEGLVTDEVRHISYTARFIESWCEAGDGPRIQSLYTRRLNDFHQLTISQTEAAVHAYGGGRYPELLEI